MKKVITGMVLCVSSTLFAQNTLYEGFITPEAMRASGSKVEKVKKVNVQTANVNFWEYYTYRDEEGLFNYLYNEEINGSPIVYTINLINKKDLVDVYSIAAQTFENDGITMKYSCKTRYSCSNDLTMKSFCPGTKNAWANELRHMQWNCSEDTKDFCDLIKCDNENYLTKS